MLDDKQQLRSYDKSNMIDGLARFPDQIKEAVVLAENVMMDPILKIDNVIVTGMGASAISGDIAKCMLIDRLDVPVYVNRDYELPRWANKDTLAIFLSYSGNTEETLSSFKMASQKKCKIIGVSSGGKLLEFCEKREVPHIKIPEGYQPRAATPYLLFPLLIILKRQSLLKTNIDVDIQETIQVTQGFVDTHDSVIPESSNPAKQLARKLVSTIPQIYGWGYYSPIAIRWRHQFNENSKIIARDDVVPECNHNDIVGWSGNPEISKLFSCILFRDRDDETERMTTRLDFLKGLFEPSVAHCFEVYSKGNSRLAKMMYLMCLGDFTSYYLAILRGIDPSPVDIITELKKRLAEK